MDLRIREFIAKNRIAALTIMLPDGTPHAATVHFAHQDNPTFKLFFMTEKTTRKCSSIINGENAKAAVVIGFSEKEWVTLQMEGNIHIVYSKDLIESVKSMYFLKYPGMQKYEANPQTVFLEFSPTWWRYSDLSGANKLIVSSD